MSRVGFHALSLSSLLTYSLFRSIQGLFRTGRALLGWWPCHPTSRLAKVTFGTITAPRSDFEPTPFCHRLFHSHINDVTPEPHERTAFDVERDFSLFSLKYNDEDGSNDLVGCLANQIFPKLPTRRGSLNSGPVTTGELAITVAADVIAFAPVRDENLPSYQDTLTGKPQRKKFSFPESFYLDRFLMQNHERAQKVIQNASVAEEEIRRLIKKRSEFTKLDVSGVPSALAFRELTSAIEQGCYEEHQIFAILLRERSTLSNKPRTSSSHRGFCG